MFAPTLRRLLCWAIAAGRRRSGLKDSTLAQYRAKAERRLDRLLAERALSPSVIFCKVTNGFRSLWGTNVHALIRSGIGTGHLNGLSVQPPALSRGRNRNQFIIPFLISDLDHCDGLSPEQRNQRQPADQS